MPANIAAVETKPDQRSVIDVAISDLHWNNDGQSEINERLSRLLIQLRGADPALCGSGTSAPKAIDDGYLNALKGAVSRHGELNQSILEKVAELESLLS